MPFSTNFGFSRFLESPDDDVMGFLHAVLTGDEATIQRMLDLPQAVSFFTPASEVLVRSYGYTDPAFVDAFQALKQRGVDVVMIADRSQALGRAERPVLERTVQILGVDKLAVGTSEKGAILHEKTLLIDCDGKGVPVIVTGSYNWSLNAQKQRNLVHVLGGTDYSGDGSVLRERFFAEFARIKTEQPQYQPVNGKLP